MSSTQMKKSTLHSQLKANYRPQWDEDTDRLCAAALSELVKEIGEERLAKAVKSMIANENFFQVANLRKHIPSADVHREATVCANCRDLEGWLWVMVDGEKTARLFRCKHENWEQGRQIRVHVGCGSDMHQAWATVV